jgi:cell wall-associated NlpC family hydrolase
MLYWARIHHRASRSNPQVGDVVIYGNGSHAGIYIGGGRVISALNPRQGIRVTRLHALGAPFTTFIHTRI